LKTLGFLGEKTFELPYDATESRRVFHGSEAENVEKKPRNLR
jgi:hypothetical protein